MFEERYLSKSPRRHKQSSRCGVVTRKGKKEEAKGVIGLRDECRDDLRSCR